PVMNSVPKVTHSITAPALQPGTSEVFGTPGLINTAAYVPPRAISHPAPEYPDLARKSNITGDVVLLLSISSSGHVDAVKVLQGNPMLVAAAEPTVKNWKYSPARSNGAP